MTSEFKLPDLGENIGAGDVVSILVAVGETIAVDQPVLELETDKATIEVPSSVSGVVKEILVKTGDTAKVGQTILTLEAGGDGPKAEVASPPVPAAKSEPVPVAQPPEPELPPAPATGETVEFKLPDLGENTGAGDVIGVLVAVGDTIAVDQGVLEIETDKATVEVPSSVSGVVKEILVKTGERARVGQTILVVESTGRPVAPAAAPSPPSAAAPPKQAEPLPAPAVTSPPAIPAAPAPVLPSGKLAPASPSIRRLARELGVDVNQVLGTGPRGRILQADVKNYVRQLNLERAAGPAASPAAGLPVEIPPLPDFSKWGEIEREAMNNIRKATVRQMSLAWSLIPHVTQHDEADITDLEQLRKQYGKKAEAAGGKLTVTAILIKVLGLALKQFPKFNASIDAAKQEVVYKKYYHIGVAVDTPRGLVVPIIRNVDQKSIIDISVELGQVAQKARDRKVTPDDLQGATFTVTNLGGIGGTSFTPIVNYPEVAILGISRSKTVTVLNKEGQVEARLMMPLSLSFDHRLIDGADAARFLRWIIEALEQPFLLVLER